MPIHAPPPACPYPAQQIARLTSKRELPPEVAAAMGEMADAGEPFQVSDAVDTGPRLPFRRFDHAEGRGCTLSIDYEQGGRGQSRPTARFTYDRGAWTRAPSR